MAIAAGVDHPHDWDEIRWAVNDVLTLSVLDAAGRRHSRGRRLKRQSRRAPTWVKPFWVQARARFDRAADAVKALSPALWANTQAANVCAGTWCAAWTAAVGAQMLHASNPSARNPMYQAQLGNPVMLVEQLARTHVRVTLCPDEHVGCPGAPPNTPTEMEIYGRDIPGHGDGPYGWWDTPGNPFGRSGDMWVPEHDCLDHEIHDTPPCTLTFKALCTACGQIVATEPFDIMYCPHDPYCDPY